MSFLKFVCWLARSQFPEGFHNGISIPGYSSRLSDAQSHPEVNSTNFSNLPECTLRSKE
jgi:hypothetical protein